MKNTVALILILTIALSPLTKALDCVWTGAIDDNWSTPGNWSCGMVPGIADVVTINNDTVILDVNSEIETFNLSGVSQLKGSADLQINGDFNWTGGAFFGAVLGDGTGGTVTVSGQTIMTGAGGNGGLKKLSGKSLQLNGGGTYLGGSLTIQDNAIFEIANNSIFSIALTQGAQIFSNAGSQFVNHGTLKCNSNANIIMDIFNEFTNNDSIIINSGTLKLRGFTMQNATVVSSSLLLLGAGNLTNTAFSGGIIRKESGICEIHPGTTIASKLELHNGIVINHTNLTLSKPLEIANLTGSIVGTYQGSAGSTLTTNGLFKITFAGILAGEGTIIVNDSLWINGTMSFANGSNFIVDLMDTTIWSDGDIRPFSESTKITNYGTFIISDSTNNLLSKSNTTVAVPSFINEGVLTKIRDAVTTINLRFTNNGIVGGMGTFNFAIDSVHGTGTINPGFSPGILTLDGATVFKSGIEIEIDGNGGPGVGWDETLVNGIDIQNGFFRLSGLLSVPFERRSVIECITGDSCYDGTFDVAYLPSDYRLSYFSDRIEVVQGPGCVGTWKVDYLYLNNNPHLENFQSSNKIISNGILTSGEQIIFDAPKGIELDPGFEVSVGASLNVLLVGCPAPTE